MANVKISGLPTGAALDGTELVPVVQGGVTIQTTSQDIADLAAGGVTSVNTQTGAVVLDTDDIAEGAMNLYSTYANINAALGLPTNSFMFSDATSQVVAYSSWGIDPDTKFANISSAYQPNNLSGAKSGINLYVGINPLQASPNESINGLSLYVDLDTAANGFDFGTSGNAGNLISASYNYHGNGSTYGGLGYCSFSSSLGNGTDPVTVKGMGYVFGFLNLNANATMDGQLQGYGFQPGFDAASITTSNFNVNAFYDFSNLPVTVHGYNTLIANPIIGTIANNTNYNGVNIGAQITTLAGNAGYTGLGVYPTITTAGTGGFQGVNMNPTITTMQSNSSFSGIAIGGTITTMGATSCNVTGYQYYPTITTAHGYVGGVNLNPQIAGGDADVTLISGGLSNVTTSSTNCSVLQLNGALSSGANTTASIDGVRFNVSGVLTGKTDPGVQGQHILFTQYSTPDSTTITADILMNILSPDVNMGDATSYVNMGGNGLGVNMVGFAGQVHGHGGMDQLSALIAGAIFLEDFTVVEWRGVNSLLINAGYTGACTNATGFYHEVGGAGVFATNHWGVKIASDIDNSMFKLAINTASGKVTNASVGLEIGGTDRAFLCSRLTNAEEGALTAINGMIIYNSDTNKFRGYENGAWVDLV